MTTTETSQRNGKSNGLKVFKTPDGQFYVESSEKKICYRVHANNGSKSCSCGDYTSRIEKDPSFICKHIMAVINGNGNVRNVEINQNQIPKLDERFVMKIKTKEFVLYSGLLDLAHQKGIRRIAVDPVQYPTKDNKMEAICRATVESSTGELFIEIADANPLNVNRMVVEHILRVAATRAKARALRDFTNIGMTCLEELGELDDSDEDSRSKTRARRETRPESTNAGTTTQAPPKPEQPKGGVKPDDRRTEPDQKPQAKKEAAKGQQTGSVPAGAEPSAQRAKAEAVPDSQNQEGQIKPSEAQITAIEKLAERRGINGEQLVKLFTDKYQKPYEQINASEAKGFIRHLQMAA